MVYLVLRLARQVSRRSRLSAPLCAETDSSLPKFHFEVQKNSKHTYCPLLLQAVPFKYKKKVYLGRAIEL